MGTAPVKKGEGRPPVCNAAVAFRAVCGERARAMVVRSASITVPRNAPFSRTTTPRMVEPKGEHTSSFNWPGCLPDSSTSLAEPETACAAICWTCGRFSPSARRHRGLHLLPAKIAAALSVLGAIPSLRLLPSRAPPRSGRQSCRCANHPSRGPSS